MTTTATDASNGVPATLPLPTSATLFRRQIHSERASPSWRIAFHFHSGARLRRQPISSSTSTLTALLGVLSARGFVRRWGGTRLPPVDVASLSICYPAENGLPIALGVSQKSTRFLHLIGQLPLHSALGLGCDPSLDWCRARTARFRYTWLLSILTLRECLSFSCCRSLRRSVVADGPPSASNVVLHIG